MLFVVKKDYSTVTDLSLVTNNTKYIPFLTYTCEVITNRFNYHKKELIESIKYKDFNIIYIPKV